MVIFLWVWDTVWELLLVVGGYYKGQKSLYHVWLDAMSHFYVAFNYEEVRVIACMQGGQGLVASLN
jgi:hypothetical protein